MTSFLLILNEGATEDHDNRVQEQPGSGSVSANSREYKHRISRLPGISRLRHVVLARVWKLKFAAANARGQGVGGASRLLMIETLYSLMCPNPRTYSSMVHMG